MLSGIKGASAYFDAVIVMRRSEAEHRENLEVVLKRISEFGFQIRPKKCSFFQTRVKYLGCIIEQNGFRLDPSKVAAIQKMPGPKDVSTLTSFLGLINYYGSFFKEMR